MRSLTTLLLSMHFLAILSPSHALESSALIPHPVAVCAREAGWTTPRHVPGTVKRVGTSHGGLNTHSGTIGASAAFSLGNSGEVVNPDPSENHAADAHGAKLPAPPLPPPLPVDPAAHPPTSADNTALQRRGPPGAAGMDGRPAGGAGGGGRGRSRGPPPTADIGVAENEPYDRHIVQVGPANVGIIRGAAREGAARGGIFGCIGGCLIGGAQKYRNTREAAAMQDQLDVLMHRKAHENQQVLCGPSHLRGMYERDPQTLYWMGVCLQPGYFTCGIVTNVERPPKWVKVDVGGMYTNHGNYKDFCEKRLECACVPKNCPLRANCLTVRRFVE